VMAYRAIRTFAVVGWAGSAVMIMNAVVSTPSGRIGAGHVAEQVVRAAL
jgi:hypothetical protein